MVCLLGLCHILGATAIRALMHVDSMHEIAPAKANQCCMVAPV